MSILPSSSLSSPSSSHIGSYLSQIGIKTIRHQYIHLLVESNHLSILDYYLVIRLLYSCEVFFCTLDSLFSLIVYIKNISYCSRSLSGCHLYGLYIYRSLSSLASRLHLYLYIYLHISSEGT